MAPHSRERAEAVIEKVEFVEECLEILATKQSLSKAAFLDSPEDRDVVERRLEKATQACIDIARMLLKDIDGNAPSSYSKAMERLGTKEILTDETSTEMAQAAQFRNVLAHEYGDVIDDDLVFEALHDLERYRTFLHEIRAYFDDVGVL